MKKAIKILIAAAALALVLCLASCGKTKTTTTSDTGKTTTSAPGSSDAANGGKTAADGNKTEENTVSDYPVVTITMQSGETITAELYPEYAPNTVKNFISLANSGFYDGTLFHRVIPGFMIQGGDPDGTGFGGPDYSIKGEFAANGVKNTLRHTRGVLSMARATPYDSAGSQFFIMVDTASYLDGSYAAFGKVIDGMDVVDKIVSQKTNANDRPLEDQVMRSVSVDTKGVEYGEPETIHE